MLDNTITLLALLVLTSLINGCGAPTSSKIIEKMFETEISSASIDVHIDIDLDADVDDEDVTSIIKTDLQILAQDIRNRDDVIVNITGTSNVIIFGDEYQNKEAIDIYYKGDNSQELYYFYSDDNKYYIYPNNIINGIEVDKDKNKKIKKSLNNICKKAKVGKKLETFNGEACYSLEIIPTSKQHEEIINIFLSLIGIEDDERDIQYSADSLRTLADIKEKGYLSVQGCEQAYVDYFSNPDNIKDFDEFELQILNGGFDQNVYLQEHSVEELEKLYLEFDNHLPSFDGYDYSFYDIF